jgi:aminopeptidase N
VNVSTDDFRQVMEQASGNDLSWFFDQWLKRPGMPALSGGWRYNGAAKRIEIEIAQTQPGAAYRLPLEVGIQTGGSQPRMERIELTAKHGRFTIPAGAEPSAVVLDPNTWVLMEDARFAKRP